MCSAGNHRHYGIERYWKYAQRARIVSRINTDRFHKRAPKAQASRGSGGHVPPGKFFRFWLPKALFPGFTNHSGRILASSSSLRWSLANQHIIWHLVEGDRGAGARENRGREGHGNGRRKGGRREIVTPLSPPPHHLLRVPDTDDVKQKNKNRKTI